MRKLISSLLAGCMILSASPAMAADINIKIDNEEFIPKNALGEVVEPFIENGSTYLPVRAMGEAVGKTVKFDAENYAVYIGEEPADEDKTKEPLMLIEDRIVYKGDLEDSVFLNDMVTEAKVIKLAESKFTEAKVIKLAESKFTEEEIAEVYDEIISWLGEAQLEGYEDYYYYCACQQLLNLDIPEGCADYEEYATVQHILVDDEETAIKVIDALNNGADFGDLIEEYNQDPGQKKDSTYTFTFGEMVEEFEKASFELEVEKYTIEPVVSDYGYHVIIRLPLNEYIADAHYYQTNILPVEIENTACKVVNIEGAGEYGKINSVIYTGDMLKKVNKLFTGEDTFFFYHEAFEYAGAVTMINSLARKSGIVDEDGIEEFDLDYEMALFTELYKAMFDGKLTFSDEDAEKSSEAIEIEVFKKIKVFVDGKLIVPCDVNNNYVEPRNVNGTVYVPVRAIVEALSMTADWDNDTRTVVITK